MGRGDNRHTPKMKRKRSQAKLKARIKRKIDTAKAAKKATQLLTWKAPSSTRNSPTKPAVPGRPTEAKVNSMNMKA